MDKICCPQCQGEGEISLADVFEHLAESLELLRKSGPMTATEAHAIIGRKVGITALNNRFEDLRRLGFASRRKQGRQWIYEAVSR